MVQINFNATQYDPSTGSQDVFEPGEYAFQIVKSDTKPTKAGGGTMLVFECVCLDDGFAGKRLTIRLNIVNQNPQAVEIAFRDLSAISHVCGILAWQDTQQLHGRPFRVRLDKQLRTDIQQDPNNPKYNNEIRAYLDMNGQTPVKGQIGGASGGGNAPVAPPQPPNSRNSPPPWCNSLRSSSRRHRPPHRRSRARSQRRPLRLLRSCSNRP